MEVFQLIQLVAARWGGLRAAMVVARWSGCGYEVRLADMGADVVTECGLRVAVAVVVTRRLSVGRWGCSLVGLNRRRPTSRDF